MLLCWCGRHDRNKWRRSAMLCVVNRMMITPGIRNEIYREFIYLAESDSTPQPAPHYRFWLEARPYILFAFLQLYRHLAACCCIIHGLLDTLGTLDYIVFIKRRGQEKNTLPFNIVNVNFPTFSPHEYKFPLDTLLMQIFVSLPRVFTPWVQTQLRAMDLYPIGCLFHSAPGG